MTDVRRTGPSRKEPRSSLGAAHRSVLDGRRRGLRAIASDGGAGGHRFDRLYGSWQFCNEYPGRREISAMGCFGRVLVANLIAMLFQSLSAKLGIATGRNLARNVP